MPTGCGPFDIEAVRFVLAPDGTGTAKTVSSSFYSELDTEFEGFRGHALVQRFAFDEPWPMWEMHPKGDEFVYLLEGDTDFLLRIDGDDRRLRLSQPGSFVVVPRGTWHTARPRQPTTLLFVTPGEGTRNEPTPPES